MQWTLKAKVRCDALLDPGKIPLTPSDGHAHECIRSLQILNPRTVKGRHSAIASEFDLKVMFEAAGTEEAYGLGHRCAQEVCATFSFLASGPADVRNISITNAPDNRVRGTEYIGIVDGDLESKIPTTNVPAQDAAFLILPKPERVVRALRWIQKSHFANDDPLDEFTYLMIAFESVSHLFKEPGVQYWRCHSCDNDVPKCPLCGESTASRMSGATAMREFVLSLGWSKEDWRTVWEHRSKLVHGHEDVSMEEKHTIREYLPKLEDAVLAAVKSVCGLPEDHSPKHGRHRVPFSDLHVEIRWRAATST